MSLVQGKTNKIGNHPLKNLKFVTLRVLFGKEKKLALENLITSQKFAIKSYKHFPFKLFLKSECQT
jgi:hypothetical protein